MQFTNLKSKKLQCIRKQADVSGISSAHLPRLSEALYTLRTAKSIKDLPTEWKLHPLEFSKGKRIAPEKIVWSMRVSAQWRLTFRMDRGAICDLDFVQYH